MSFPGGISGKEPPPASAIDIRDMNSIPGSGRFPGEGHGNPLQYSCLENPMDRGAWRATVHSITKSWTRRKQLSTAAQHNVNFCYLLFIKNCFKSLKFASSSLFFFSFFLPSFFFHASLPFLSPSLSRFFRSLWL